MQAKDVMTRDVITVLPNTTVEVIAKLLTENRINARLAKADLAVEYNGRRMLSH